MATIVWGATAWTAARIATDPAGKHHRPGSSGEGASTFESSAANPTSSAARVQLLRAERLGQEVSAPSAMALVCCCSWPAAVRMMTGSSATADRGASRSAHPGRSGCGIMRSSITRQMSVATERLEGFASVVRQSNAEGPLLELHLDDAADVRFVVGDEHVARGRVGHGESMRLDGAAMRSRLRRISSSSCPTAAPGDIRTKHGICRQHRYDRQSAAVLRTAVSSSPPRSATPSLVGGAQDGGIRRRCRRRRAPGELAVDQQPVASEDDARRLPALPDGSDQILNARHSVVRASPRSGGEARDRSGRSQAAPIA